MIDEHQAVDIIQRHKLNIAEDNMFERVYPSLGVTAQLKTLAEDFVVTENLAVDFTGEGEHCWLYIKKQGANTDWVAQQLARFCGVKKMAVSYAGLKDRHAVTSQWFSVHLPGLPTPDWHAFESAFNGHTGEPEESETAGKERVEVLQSYRHNKKLQRGALKSNTFSITLRELSDTSEAAFSALMQRCEEISLRGVPNYFGEQRFGQHDANLAQAEKLFSRPRTRISRHKRSLYLSAARSWLFNSVLSERVKQRTWDKRIAGDVFMLNGRSACFRDDDSDIETRLARNEIHPTAVLWGRGDTMVTADAAALEFAVIERHPLFRDGLVAAGLEAQRRACRLIPGQMSCRREQDNFVVCFQLPAGCYATVVLGEIFSVLRPGSVDDSKHGFSNEK